MKNSATIKKIYVALLKSFGPQHWWPGDTPFEIMVGAVLTQNTNWGNVEKAIAQLKREGLLSLEAMRDVPVEKLAKAIRPAGYFNVKARRLKNLVYFIVHQYGGDLKKMKGEPSDVLRRQLLSVNGVGPETADSILLYALDKPVFVVDAYTRRFLRRHNLIEEKADYHDIQRLFTDVLPADALVFNEYHALIVRLGKDVCRPSARCEVCPLNRIHYAVKKKCRHCHRTFAGKEKTYSVPGASGTEGLCGDCHALLKVSMKRPVRWG
jgi:endonuclease-3 related protein